MLLHSAAVGSVAGAGEVLVSPAKPATAMEAAAAATMSRRTASRQAGCTVYEETRCRGSTRSQAQKEEGNLSVGTRLHLHEGQGSLSQPDRGIVFDQVQISHWCLAWSVKPAAGQGQKQMIGLHTCW